MIQDKKLIRLWSNLRNILEIHYFKNLQYTNKTLVNRKQIIQLNVKLIVLIILMQKVTSFNQR
ncbi:unnamed protein product [Paramecium sonneborni]|uniref:Uncharacterized protein n=1 Tax=Paramecium sonneborni TaxID=65129 RepID=A0A8S1NPV9_9CILI|nr:unnamed protein product [Paramecium sonneborni]